MLRIKCSVCRVEHRVVERKDVEGTKKGEERERDSRRKRRARFRLALLHNFIALSLVFAARKKSGKRGTQGWRGGYFIIRWEEFFACEYDRRNALRMKLPYRKRYSRT